MNTFSRSRLVLRVLLPAALLAASAGPARAQQSTAPVSLTLMEAIMRAIASSQDLGLARARYEAAQRQTAVARALFLPNLYAGSGAAYTSGFPILAGGGAPAAFSMSYTQDLLDPLSHAQERSAEQTAEQQRLAVDGMRDTVVVNVASAYLQLAKVRRELGLLRSERDSATRILDYIRDRVAAGYELPIEVTRAQLTSARVDQRIEQLQDQDETLSDQLRQQLALGPDQAIEVMDEDIPTLADRTVNDLVRDAMQTSVDIKQAQSAEMAASARLSGERRSYLPTVSLIGQYNLLTKFNNYTEFFNKFERNNFVAGLQVNVPIFASRHSSGIASARADLNVAQQAEQSKRNQLTLDVRRQAHHVRETDTGREVARLETDLARQNVQIVQDQFQEGRASVRDVESAQLDENDKSLALDDADFARQQAQLDLLRSTGQLSTLYP